MSNPDTRNRILDKAEELFAERGVDAVSVRELTGAAGVNLAAVNYHFGTKDDLVAAIMARRVVPVNDERLARLDELEARGRLDADTLEPILEAFIEPAIRAFSNPGHHQFFRMLARLAVGGAAQKHVVHERAFREVRDRFLRALRAACPELEADAVERLFYSLVGVLIMPLAQSSEPVPPEHVSARTGELVTFTAGGFRARVEQAAHDARRTR